MEKAFRKTGIDIIGDAPWGTHICQFYQTKKDLIDILVSYFKAGLENNEFCMWITSEPLKVKDAKSSLNKVVKNLDHFIKKGQIEILDYSEWYTKSGKFDANNVLQGWIEKENQALKRGYDGLRLSGNTFWLAKGDWRNFTDYEEEINNVIGKYRMIAICTYSLGKCGASKVIDVVSNHQFALIRREGKWVIIESSERRQTEEALKKSEERFRTSVENLPEGFAILSAVRDRDGNIIDFKYEYINEAGCKMNQKPLEEHMGKTLLELLPTHKEIGLFDEYVRVVETGQSLTKEFLIYETVYGSGERLRQAFDVRITRLGDGFVTTWQDITDKKKGEELLRQSEERLKLLIENSKDVVIMADLEGSAMYYNGPPEYGITAEEVLGKNPFSIFEPAIAASLMNQLKLVIKSGEALTFENNIPGRGESFWFLNQMYPIRDEKGRMIAVGVTARNITERKRAEETLRVSLEKYRVLFESFPLGITISDESGKIMEGNRQSEQLLGITREVHAQRRIDSKEWQIIQKDGTPMPADEYASTRALRENRLIENVEMGIVKDKGEITWISVTAAPIPLEGYGVAIAYGDITERKRAEEKQRESEEWLRAMFEHMSSGVAVYKAHEEGQDFVFKDFNPAAERITRITREQAVGHRLLELFPYMDRSGLLDALRRVWRTGQSEHLSPFYYKDTIREGWRENRIYKLPSGEVVAIFDDITERKRAEERLQFTQFSLDNAADTMVCVDHDARFIDVNDAFCRSSGYSREELLSMTVHDIDPDYSAEIWPEFWEKLKQSGSLTFETCHRSKEGRIFPVEITASYLEYNGKEYHCSFARDITERKRVEGALRASEYQYRTTIDSMGDAIHVVDNKLQMILVNKTLQGWCKGLGLETEIVGKPIFEIFPFLPDEVREQYRSVFESGQLFISEEQNIVGDQKIFTETRKIPVFEEGKVIRVVTVMHDITERKRVEEVLRRKSGEQALLLDNIQTQIWYLTNKETYGAVNKARAEFFGKKNEEMENKKVCDVLSKDEAEICMSGYVEVFEKRKQIHTEEWITNAKGEKRLLSIIKSPKLDENGDIEYVVCSAEDITERKRAEEALRETEELYRTILQTSPDGIAINDTEGRITFVSERMLSLYGLIQPEDVIGHSPFEFIAPEDHARARLNMQNVFKNNYTSYNQYTLVKKGGTKFTGEINSSLLRDTSGKPKGMISVIRDITERKQAEKERDQFFEEVHASHERLRNLSRRLVEVQEVERHDLVRKLHDEVGQNLTALGINLNIVHSQLPPETVTETVTRIDDSLKLVEETVERIRDVMAELRPPVLDDYGLSAALHWYGKQFSERTGFITLLQVEELKLRLPLSTETALFRIAQEALTNVAKHAQAKNVTVRLEEFGESVHLSIADDGIGFDSEAHQQTEAKLEWGLINMRERAQAIGGQLSVETAPGKGTQIIVEVPRKH